MNCNDFREHIAERLAGELPTDQAREFEAHGRTCPSCRRALHDWQQLEGMLRTEWPSEDPPATGFFPLPTSPPGWLHTTGVWFARASMALVAACLLLLLLLRPSVQLKRNGLSLALGRASFPSSPASGAPVSEEQLRVFVQATVQQAVTQESLRLQAATRSQTDWPSEDAQRWAQVGLHLKMLEQSQAFLWRQLQQQGLYLQSVWRGSTEHVQPNSSPRSQRQ